MDNLNSDVVHIKCIGTLAALQVEQHWHPQHGLQVWVDSGIRDIQRTTDSTLSKGTACTRMMPDNQRERAWHENARESMTPREKIANDIRRTVPRPRRRARPIVPEWARRADERHGQNDPDTVNNTGGSIQ